MPGLRLGKLPADSDWCMLFLPGPDDITGPDKSLMDEWAERYKTDPRSSSNTCYQLDEGKQRTLLEWLGKNLEACQWPVLAPAGCPRELQFPRCAQTPI